MHNKGVCDRVEHLREESESGVRDYLNSDNNSWVRCLSL